ncbi:hypothetical protein ABZ942_35250 [Nocardia sp. NPDC046473]|uniref:hypothetical protein n=1 Tax=Nocardia sp. NPDC046473 TaxID=3155733 RepID=UPI0033FC3A3E
MGEVVLPPAATAHRVAVLSFDGRDVRIAEASGFGSESARGVGGLRRRRWWPDVEHLWPITGQRVRGAVLENSIMTDALTTIGIAGEVEPGDKNVFRMAFEPRPMTRRRSR